MSASGRRPRGEAAVYWNEARQRYIAEHTVGYDARGKRVRRKASGSTEAAALRALRRRVRDYEAGLSLGSEHYRVREAVEDWLAHGQASGRGQHPHARTGTYASRTCCHTSGSGSSAT